MKDMFGTEIEVGDRVVYPVRQSSMMEMKYGVVKEVRENTLLVEVPIKTWSGTILRYRNVPLYRVDRCVVRN